MFRIFLLVATIASVCFGQADPFVPHANIPAGDSTGSLTVNDFNGDGKKDIAVINPAPFTVTVLLGDGKGHLSALPGGPLHMNSTGTQEFLVSGDFNNDSKIDLAWTEHFFSGGTSKGRIAMSFGKGDGTFLPPFSTEVPLPSPFDRMAAVDINQDGNLDVVTDRIQNPTSTSRSFAGTTFLGDGTGGFVFANTVAGSTVFGDVNADGLTDYVRASAGQPIVVLGGGLGSSPVLGGGIAGTGNAAITDYDHDGAPDLFTSGVDNILGVGIRPAFALWRGDSAGGFVFDHIYYLSNTDVFAVGDFDGDGVSDWAIANGGTVQVNLLRLPASLNQPVNFSYDAGPTIVEIRSADFDGDGKSDLVISNGWDLTLLLTSTSSRTRQTISFNTIPNRSVNGGSFAVTASASSGLPVTFSSTSPTICSVVNSTVSLLAKGTCGVRADQPGNATTQAAYPVTRTFTVTPISQTITTGAPESVALGTPPLMLQAKVSSGLPLIVSTSGPCSSNGLLITLRNVGSCQISLTQLGNQIYDYVSSGIAITITSNEKQPMTIDFPPLADRAFASSFNITGASSVSGLPISYTSNTSDVCFVATVTPFPNIPITGRKPGMCSITAYIDGNPSQYLPISPVTRTFGLTADASQTIRVSSTLPTTFALGQGGTQVIFSATSGLTVSVISNTPGVCAVAGSNVQLKSAGVCSLTGSQAGNDFYPPASPVTVQFNIVNGPTQTQSIIFPSIPNVSLGIPEFHVAVVSTVGTPTLASDTPGVCRISGMNVTLLSMGTCSLTASRPADSIYFAASVTRTFQVVASSSSYPQSITVYNSFSYATPSALSVTATASSGLLVVFTSETPAVCTSPVSTVVLANALGTCVITLTQPGNSVFAPAIPQKISFPVLAPLPPPGQTISIAPIGNKTLGDPSFPVIATANSGLPITYTTSTSGVCRLSENWVTLVGVGTCNISASRSGDVFFNSANASTSFSVSDIARIAPAIQSIKNGASYAVGVLAPSSYGSIFGTNFLISPVVTLHDANGADFTLTQSYTSDTQINVQVPANVALGSATLAVKNSSGTSQLPLTIAAVAPGIVSLDATGSGPAAAEVQVVNADKSVSKYGLGLRAVPVGPNAEAYLILYASGVRGHSPNGVSARVGGLPVEVLYAGRVCASGLGDGKFHYPSEGSVCFIVDPALDQVILKLPPAVGSLGLVEVQLTVDGIDANPVAVYFEGTDVVRYTRSR